MRKFLLGHLATYLLAPSLFVFVCTQNSFAQTSRFEAAGHRPPKNALSNLSIFSKSFNASNILEVVDVSNVQINLPVKAHSRARLQDVSAPVAAPQEVTPQNKLEYWSDRPEDVKLRPPQENPLPRVNPESPSSIHGLITAMRDGDKSLADRYADEYVHYLQNYFFELNSITQAIGEALIRQKLIDEDDWVGVPQRMEYELAKTRHELGEVIKPTHDAAMRRIKSDTRNQAKVYFFFTMNCSWCRYMAADVERLWRLVKDDPNVEMVALTLGPTPNEWITEYRQYTGLSIPIFEGSDLAKSLNVAFVPAVVVVAPTDKRAYLKTGQQSFEHMYEFVRTVQGLPATVTPEFQQAQQAVIGQAELLLTQQRNGQNKLVHVPAKPVRERDSIERF